MLANIFLQTTSLHGIKLHLDLKPKEIVCKQIQLEITS